jgi:hypothetical protein
VLVRIVLWNLADSMTTIEELRRYLRDESVDEFAEVESRDAADQPMPTGARELIGKDPDLFEEFELEASVEGRFIDAELSHLGLAFE